MIRSTHIILEPNTQARVQLENAVDLSFLCPDVFLPIPLTHVMIHPLVSLSRPIFAALPAATQQFLKARNEEGGKSKESTARE